MANIYEQIKLYENNLLINIAAFMKRLTGLPIFIMNKPFVRPDGPYLALRIVSSSDSGGWSQRYAYNNDSFSYLMDNTYDVELVAYRGRPMSMMTYILAALRGAQELKYQYLYSKGIGFLSATNIAQADTVLDGDKTEPRARVFLTFNSAVVMEDLPTTEITSLSINVESYRDSKSDPSPIIYKLEDNYGGPRTIVHPSLEGGSSITIPSLTDTSPE